MSLTNKYRNAMKDENKCRIAKATRFINRIIVHCTATPEGKAFYAKDIDRWHRANGWAGIGYHYVVDLDGKVELGRSINSKGAHAGEYNYGSIGIVYVGGMTADNKKAKDTRTEAQKESLLWLLKEMKRMYPNAQFVGHRDLPGVKKACPCFDVKTEYKDL